MRCDGPRQRAGFAPERRSAGCCGSLALWLGDTATAALIRFSGQRGQHEPKHARIHTHLRIFAVWRRIYAACRAGRASLAPDRSGVVCGEGREWVPNCTHLPHKRPGIMLEHNKRGWFGLVDVSKEQKCFAISTDSNFVLFCYSNIGIHYTTWGEKPSSEIVKTEYGARRPFIFRQRQKNNNYPLT